MSDPDTVLLEAEEHMNKAIDYLRQELKGVRTGRASTGLVEFVKVDYYGSPTDLKAIAAINIPEPTQILIKPFDAGSIQEINKALEASDLGLNPQVDGKQIRINVPALSGDRRKQLVGHVKKMGEEQKIVLRNARRDANKHAEALKDQNLPEDEISTLKEEIQDLLKKYEKLIDDAVDAKSKDVLEV
ncbi:MAG: ribosome recycling factor [Planctomycetota bacterium]